MSKVRIAPSVLAVDFSCLYEEIKRVEKEVDLLHFDIMDGHFVPNITFGPQMVASLREKISLPFEVHLMVDNPQEWIDPFEQAGSDTIIFHLETSSHPHRLITFIKEKGIRVGIALNPSTSLENLKDILPQLDMVLLMTVNPGFGGQTFLPEVLPKIGDLRQICRERKLFFNIEVDGGINQWTAAKAVEAGADILVVGTAVFDLPNPQEAVRKLKEVILKRKE
ncbi:MAG: ribulose-phosphate 3-epimerase [Candidatus Aerophobetes bacterium]|nr:ribulose-phosphate 3-epimerase [Candidatus Aerophobetes bacterium]